VAGRIECHYRETALGHEAAGASDDARGLLVLAAAVAHQNQRTGTGGVVRRPQHAGDLTGG
jgi:hypothetical protein